MPNDFPYDVFLSHSAKDKDVVRGVAERLRADGLRVWFDEWVLKPGDSIPAKIEEGLEHSRVLVLCMSANAFGSDWAQLESGTFRFRDPLNKDRRFIPLRLDDAPIKGSLAQLLFINWLPANREREYAKLLEVCRPPIPKTETTPYSQSPLHNADPTEVQSPVERLRALRQEFDFAVQRLDAIPENELSPTGQPFLKECADALLAFAAWFGEQTPDHLAMSGSAHRIQFALRGLSGVIDWVAFHRSVPLASEIEHDVAELIGLADTFDEVIIKSFKVPSKPNELRLERRPLSERIYADIEQRIAEIAGLTSRLGGRLQRVAVWVSQGCQPGNELALHGVAVKGGDGEVGDGGAARVKGGPGQAVRMIGGSIVGGSGGSRGGKGGDAVVEGGRMNSPEE